MIIFETSHPNLSIIIDFAISQRESKLLNLALTFQLVKIWIYIVVSRQFPRLKYCINAVYNSHVRNSVTIKRHKEDNA